MDFWSDFALFMRGITYVIHPTQRHNAPIRLQAVQNRALNWITGLEQTNAEHLYSLANIPPLNVVFHKQARKTCFFFTNPSPPPPPNWADARPPSSKAPDSKQRAMSHHLGLGPPGPQCIKIENLGQHFNAVPTKIDCREGRGS